MGLAEVMSAEQLGMLAMTLGVDRFIGETDEALRMRIMDQMNGREPANYRLIINTDKPELSGEVLPF